MDGLKILVIRLSAIGDTIHTLPLVCALRKHFPDAQIDWLVEDKAAQFVKNNPVVNNVIVVPKREWKNPLEAFDGFNKIISKLKKENYDIAIDVQQLMKSALFLKFCGAKRRITLSGGREFSKFAANEIIPATHKLFDKNYHVVYRNLEIAKYLGCDEEEIEFILPKPDKTEIKHVAELLSGIDKEKKTLVLAPATTWITKHWENKYWANIINEFQNKANIIITGTKADEDLVKDILLFGKFKKVINLTGKTNLSELAEVFRNADVVVAPDSGSAQIAWACKKPFVVSVFTATSAKRTAPFGENTYAFYPDIECYPCHKKKCFSRDFELCKKKIDYYEVISILSNLLK